MKRAATSPGPVEVVGPETAPDLPMIRDVTRLALGGDEDARPVDALQDGGHARAPLVAEEDALVVGHVLFGELAIVSEGGIV